MNTLPDLPDGLASRRVGDAELADYLRFVELNFHEHVSSKYVDAWVPALRGQPFHVVEATDGYVATAGAVHTDFSLPGGARVGNAAVTVVTVRTDHRRRGVLNHMMGRVLHDAREADLEVATLYASEGTIYGRYGFGPATQAATYTIDRHHAAPFTANPRTVRLVDPATARRVVPALYESTRSQRAGLFGVSDAWWDALIVHDPDQGEDGWTRMQFALVDGHGVAAYRTKADWAPRVPNGSVRVEWLFALDGAAYRDLVAFIASIDLVSKIMIWRRPADDALPYLLADEARAHQRDAVPLWLRILDLPGFMASRTSGSLDRVTIEVTDRWVPENAGTWHLSGTGDAIACDSSRSPAEIRADISSLSTLALGGVSAQTLRDAGRLEVVDPTAVHRLSRLLATDVAAWSPLDF